MLGKPHKLFKSFYGSFLAGLSSDGCFYGRLHSLLDRPKIHRQLLVLAMIVLVLLAGCTLSAEETPGIMPDVPTPTIHPFFQEVAETQIPPAPDLETTTTPVPSATAVLTDPVSLSDAALNVQALTGFAPSDFITKTVYDDALDPNWTLVQEEDMAVNLASTETAHNGRFAAAMTPLDAWGAMYFGVSEDTAETYQQNDVFAITFWLNGGDDYIELDDLAFAVVGSNDFPYWVADDESAYYDEEYPFSETALHHLGFNSAIPPNTWVKVEVYIHELIYDPAYRFITGFYLKNADDFYNTVYVDDIKIIKFPDSETDQTEDPGPAGQSGEAEVVLTTTPTITPTVSTTITGTATLAPTNEITTTAAVSETADCEANPPTGWQLYAVQSGDTLSTLAQSRNVTTDDIVRVNCLESDTILSIGEEIWLPPLAESTDPNSP